MPRVRAYEQQVQLGGTTTARRNAPNFGPGIGAGLAIAGRALSEHLEAQTRLTEIRAEEEARRLDVEHMEAIRPLRDRVRSARGINAREALASSREELTELRSDMLSRASNPLARRMLEQSIARRDVQEVDSWSGHAETEEVRAVTAGHEARANSFIETALDHSEEPEIAQENVLAAEQEIQRLADFAGWDDATTARAMLASRSRFFVGAARRRFEADDPEGAQEILDQHGDDILAEDEATIRRMISGDLQANEADRDAAFVLSDASAPAAEESEAPSSQAPRPTMAAMISITAQSESGNRERDSSGRLVTSPAGAQGRMQVMPATARDPGYGIRPWNGQTDEDRSRVGRELLAALLRRHGGDPAKAWASYNWDSSGNRVDALVRRYGENWLDHAPAETRAYVSRNVRELGGGELPAPDGTRIDIDAAYARIEQQPWTESRKRRAREAVQRYAGQNDLVRQRTEQDAERVITQRIVEIQRDGNRLTSLSQLPSDALAQASPDTILQLQAQIDANNRREPEANSPLMAELSVMAGADPNRFLREVNPELYRGRITDAEVMQLHTMKQQITSRAGPQPSEILERIRWVLPQTSILPTVSTTIEGLSRRRQTEAREAAQRVAEGSLLAAVQRRLQQTHGRGEVTQDDILRAVRAEVTLVTVNGQRMPVYQARERGATRWDVTIPRIARPYIDEALRRQGLPLTDQNRGQLYLSNRDEIDRAVNRGRSGSGRY